MSKLVRLFEPLKLSKSSLKNRVVMGSIHTGLEEAPSGFHKMASFYRDRARGGVGLIITGGVAPNFRGRLSPFAKGLTSQRQVKKHKIITKAVHEEKSKICLQILHAGRYAYHPFNISCSALKAPINPFKPKAFSKRQIKKTVKHFIRCAKLAQSAGYDGVEIMGSEGYLLNQFLAPRTNKRTDEYGGSYENRMRFVMEIVEGIKLAVDPRFILIFRLSLMDLVDQGSTWDEVVLLAKKLERYGVDIIDSGIGWHEARVPTIATMVPRAAFRWATAKLKSELNIPVMATNRINTPEVAEDILVKGEADLISMARPFLADPDFVNKARDNKSHLINTCIGCNQACLDHIFQRKIATCLVNPKACRETEFLKIPKKHKSVAIVGSGPAGLSCAIECALLGHKVVVFEKNSEIGGQFNLAKKIPGKEEFHETIRYYKEMIEFLKIDLRLDTEATINNLINYDSIVIASGIAPRTPPIEGIENSKVIDYQTLLRDTPELGKRVAIIGAGGIGFDIAEFLAHDPNTTAESLSPKDFFAHWGVDTDLKSEGGLTQKQTIKSHREIHLFQRKTTPHGKSLGKTTGWIHRQSLKDYGVKFVKGVEYTKIDDKGLHYSIDSVSHSLEVDNIVICAGQVSQSKIYHDLVEVYGEEKIHLIGGALKVTEIDAKRAVDDGTRLAYQI